MSSLKSRMWARRPLVVACTLAVALLVGGGLISCATKVPSGGGPPADETPGGEFPGVKNIQSSIVLSSGESVTIVYTTAQGAADVTGFYVAVDASGLETGQDQTFATSLAAGQQQTTLFDTTGIPLGPYRVGIAYTRGGQSFRFTSSGIITLTGLPTPEWTLPGNDTQVVRGAVVQLRAELGDPENTVQWRVFYVPADSPLIPEGFAYVIGSLDGIALDEAGTPLEENGTANVASVAWNTASIDPGDYVVGISVTDSGDSIAATVAADDLDSIGTQFNSAVITVLSQDAVTSDLPTITVTQPAADVPVFGDAQVPVAFGAEILDENIDKDDAEIRVFYDTNNSYEQNDTETVFATAKWDATASTFDTKGVPEGNYFIGAVIDDGLHAPVADYAPGRVEVIREAALQVQKPSVQINRQPGDPVEIAWTTNVPVGYGTVSVYAVRLVGDTETGSPIAILSSSALSTKKTTWETDGIETGKYRVYVELALDERGTLAVTAPALAVFSIAPTQFWMGELADAVSSRFDGVIFEGHQPEDNVGASFLGGEDYNGDGADEFIIVGRYAKPDFVNPSGIGDGEAYFFGGRSTRYSGVYNVNEVSSEELPGTVLTGVTPNVTIASVETYGLASIFRSEDVDGDGLGELMFGFPYVNNTQPDYQGPIRAAADANGGHFQYGGVVILSSTNVELNNRGQGAAAENSEWVSGTRIPLDWVGARFDDDDVGPEPNDGGGDLCSGNTSWTEDLLEYVEGDCPDAPADLSTDNSRGCVPGSDEQWDTLVEPDFGFNYSMGLSLMEQFNGTVCPGFTSDCPTCLDTNTIACIQATSCNDGFSADACDCKQFDVDNLPIDPSPADWGDRTCTLAQLPIVTSGDDGGARQDGCEHFQECYDDCMRYVQKYPLVAVGNGPPGEGAIPNPRSPDNKISSGYYPDEVGIAPDNLPNEPRWPFGCRILGRPTDANHTDNGLFGASITQSGLELIISAPYRAATSNRYVLPPFT